MTRCTLPAWQQTGVVEVVAETASTNSDLLNYARRLGTLTPARALLATLQQTQGRGRHGRRWETAPGEALALSLGMRVQHAPSDLGGITLLCGLALRHALAQHHVLTTLKWPNDLLAISTPQKLAGILVELCTLPNQSLWLVIGVGLNVRSAPPEAICIAELMPESASPLEFNLTELVADFVGALEQRCELFFRQGFEYFMHEFHQHHAWQQRTVQLLQHEQVHCQGEFIGVNSQGAALIKTTQGVQTITSGELRLRVIN